MWSRPCFALASLLIAGCGCDDSAELSVDLVTDLTPGDEFHSVTVEVGERRADLPAYVGQPYLEGVRVAEVATIQPGAATVRVALRDSADAIVTERVVRATVRGSYVVTVVITRDCVGVECPGEGDD